MSNQEVDIWMPIYIGDILAKTTRMTTEQIGASFLLMMDYWRNGAIPDDNNVIASVIRMPVSKAKALKNILIHSSLFEVHEGQMSSAYLDGLKAQAESNKSSKSERAKKAADARWNKQNQDGSNPQAQNEQSPSNANAYAQAMHEDATSNACAVLNECPSSSPSSINNISLTHEQNPSEPKTGIDERFTFDLTTVNTRIKLRGLKEITQEDLSRLQQDLQDEYGHKSQMVKNQVLGKLVQWVERRQQTPLATSEKQQSKPRTTSNTSKNVNDAWKHEPQSDDRPFHGTVPIPEDLR
ncbi:DUF1376 domain-containing protein [Acinetobacter johnsonii]|uniref:DUF1376 domain-containing protein n=1 Tax=Acinetobacter johnsonii TaxID=40214 RepID=UPI001F2E713B|nr:DUF1376 domain-containing protein [Acinetobacter johnsonii]UJA04217.1 DUF1376 domain-containing protein [Acinetobacter johnsonii]